MNPAQLTTRQLQYIVAVADTGSFSAAARACFVAQPSLSAQVAQAERTLGARLFERGARRVRCTAAGEQAVARAREALRAIQEVANAVRWQGAVRVGMIDTVAPYLFAPWLKLVRERTATPVIPVQGRTNALLEQLRAGRLDAAVIALPTERNLVVHEIGRDELLLLVPGRETANPVTIADLAGREMLLLEEGHCLRDQAADVCSATGVAANTALQATSLETLIEMVAAGFGCTLLPEIASERVRKRRDLTLRRWRAEPPVRTLALVHEERNHNAAVLREIAGMASEVLSSTR